MIQTQFASIKVPVLDLISKSKRAVSDLTNAMKADKKKKTTTGEVAVLEGWSAWALEGLTELPIVKNQLSEPCLVALRADELQVCMSGKQSHMSRIHKMNACRNV
eukprot:330124-Amphidinium_carterae.1